MSLKDSFQPFRASALYVDFSIAVKNHSLPSMLLVRKNSQGRSYCPSLLMTVVMRVSENTPNYRVHQ